MNIRLFAAALICSVSIHHAASAQVVLVEPDTTYNTIGNTVFGSDGSTSTQIGSTTFGSDGTTVNQIGGTTFGSDGSTSQQIGNTTFIKNSDGTTTTCQKIGASTFCN